jgi:predicted nucleotidyltransferase
MPWVRIFCQMKMTRDAILRKLEENRETIRGFGVRRLGIFGSYARGEQKRASDMDFLVEFDDATLQNYLKLKDFLEALFQCPVDLVFADTVKPRLRPIIFDEVVYAQGL